jgi:hypothetical protein
MLIGTRTLASLAVGGSLALAVAAQPFTRGQPPGVGGNYPPAESVQTINLIRPFEPAPGQIQELARKYVKADKEEDKKDLRKKLTDLLARQFDERNQQQQKELENLERQIAELKAVLKKRADGRSAIIDRHFEQLILDAEGLGWQAPERKSGAGTSSAFSGPGYAPAPSLPPAP